MQFGLLAMKVLGLLHFVTAAPLASIRQEDDNTIVEVRISQHICESCQAYDDFFANHTIPEEERTILHGVVKRDGDICCVDQLMPVVNALTAFLLQATRSTLDETRVGLEQSEHPLTRLHVIPHPPVTSDDVIDYTTITEWYVASHGTSFLIGMSPDDVSEGIRIPSDGYYTITVRMSWRSGEYEDSTASQSPPDMCMAKLSHPRRGSQVNDQETLMEDSNLCIVNNEDDALPCASVTMTATLELRSQDILSVRVSHPSRLMGNPYSYVDMVQVN